MMRNEIILNACNALEEQSGRPSNIWANLHLVWQSQSAMDEEKSIAQERALRIENIHIEHVHMNNQTRPLNVTMLPVTASMSLAVACFLSLPNKFAVHGNFYFYI